MSKKPTTTGSSSETVKVAIRCRPLSNTEMN